MLKTKKSVFICGLVPPRVRAPLLLLVLFVSSLALCKESPPKKEKKQEYSHTGAASVPEIHLEGRAFGTSFSIKIFEKKTDTPREQSKKEAPRIEELIKEKLKEVDRVFSNWREDSEVSRFNRHDSRLPFRVSKAFLHVIQNAKKIYERSGGAFDPAQAELFSLWEEKIHRYKTKGKESPLPKSRDIQKILKRSGIRFLVISPGSRYIQKLHPKLQINLSGIAKGYGVDQVAELLHKRGFSSFMVEIGGELRVTQKETKEGKAPWRLAIEKPVYRERPMKRAASYRGAGDYGIKREIYKIAFLRNRAMASSGNYRNYFVGASGKIYSHILDPRQGFPVKNQILATSVVGPSCMIADALATSLMVLNVKEGLRMIEALPKYEALWIRGKGKGRGLQHDMSSGMAGYLESQK